MIACIPSKVARKTNLNDEYLRVIAFWAMLLDHHAYLNLEPNINYFILRIIGRLAAPIFFYLLVKGWKRSRNVKKYFFRLVFWGFISQAVLFFLNIEHAVNILLSMAVALVMLESCQKLGWYWIIFYCICAEILNLESGFYGILMCFIFGFLKGRILGLSLVLVNIFAVVIGYFSVIQLFSLLSLLLIKSEFKNRLIDGFIIKIPKIFWYLIYPLQWILIYII
ncbi:MAG: TraX family protein [Cyanobacteria bacterium J06592_8]